MKHKKSVTDAVRAANRANSRSSTGPKSKHGKSKSSQNSLSHGLLARKLFFKTKEDRSDYKKISKKWYHHHRPKTPMAKFLIREISRLEFKLLLLDGIEMQELYRRVDSLADQEYRINGLDGIFSGEMELPISKDSLSVNEGWVCDRFTVRALTSSDERNSSGSSFPQIFGNQILPNTKKLADRDSREFGHVEVTAQIGNSLDVLARYRSGLKRDLYRALETLRKIEEGV